MARSSKHKRSTNGCGVCRIRRIRCDETRPSCNQCTKTGRTCEGYPPSTTRLTSTPTRALAPLQAISQGSLTSPQSHLSAPAQRALQYYRANTARHLSGYFHDDFWTTLVLQVGHRDHCVSYALVALASLHEHFHTEATERSSLTASQAGGTTSDRGGAGALSLPMHHAVSYYAEAVRRLQAKVSSTGGEEVETTLLCCLLLAGFELLRGYHEAAQVHLHGSASLLQAWQDQQKNNRGGGSLWSPRGYFIRERLGPLFHRMALQAVLFSHVGPTSSSSLQFGGDGAAFVPSLEDRHYKNNTKERTGPGKTEVRVASPTEARDMLYRLIWQLYLLPEGQQDPTKSTKKKRARAKGRESFIRSLHQWHEALSDYLKKHPVDGASSDMLKLFHATAQVMIPTCMSDDQMAFDGFAAQFNEIADLAENLLFPCSPSTPPPTPLSAAPGSGSTNGSRAPPLPRLLPSPASQDVSYFFSLDMGVLHLLYYVAIRCRVAATRFRALELLRRAQARREGVWDGAATALVASRVVAMEEEARQEGVETGDGSSSCIPASARVGSVWTETDLENRRVVLRCGWQRDTTSSEEVLAW